MAAASRALGRERFAWSTIAQKHVALYRQIAEQKTSASLASRRQTALNVIADPRPPS
jgi:hypothetical protein